MQMIIQEFLHRISLERYLCQWYACSYKRLGYYNHVSKSFPVYSKEGLVQNVFIDSYYHALKGDKRDYKKSCFHGLLEIA